MMNNTSNQVDYGEISRRNKNGQHFDEDFDLESLSSLSRDEVTQFEFDIDIDLLEQNLYKEFDENYAVEYQTHENKKEQNEDQSSVAQKIIAVSVPKVVKHDIRRYFSNMFMNTVNSADFHRTEDFFSTFMQRRCTFASQQELDPVFRVPKILQSVGPRQFAHYLLGCFVMYPDMALSMTDTQIVTSNTWAGTKITMQVEYQLTKTYDIPVECWVPPEEALSRVYSERTLEGMMTAMKLSSSDIDQGAENEKDICSVTNSSSLSTVSSTGQKRKKRGRKSAVVESLSSYIPNSFIETIHTHALMVEQPRVLKVKGEFVLYLDEKNLIQHAVLNGQQLN